MIAHLAFNHSSSLIPQSIKTSYPLAPAGEAKMRYFTESNGTGRMF